jgi:hypothetical protein
MLKSVANFSLYLASFVASVVITLAAPGGLLKQYLLIYTLASFAFSLLLFLYFSASPTMRGTRLIAGAFFVSFIAVSVARGPYESALFFYPGLLIYSDYLVTQSCDIRRVTAYRMFLILSSLFFLAGAEYFQGNMIARVTMIFLVALVLPGKDGLVHKISVQSPIPYLIGNYVFYSGVLYAVTIFTDHGGGLRFWYLMSQAGLVGIIKYYDFSLRKEYSVTPLLKFIVMCTAFVIPLPLMFIYPSLPNLCLYYIGYFGLLYTGKFIAR